MNISVPREIKIHEYRVALTPAGAAELCAAGHQVTIEHNAGLGSGFDDDAYRAAGASIESDKKRLFAAADLIVKIKEPLQEELGLFRPGQILFTYLHLAAMEGLTRQLLQSRISAIGYETVTDSRNQLPLLHPMSLIAGRVAIQVGANLLQKSNGGRGVLLAGAPGAGRGRVLVLGAGTVGEHAVEIGIGMGAEVVVLNRSTPRLEYLENRFGHRISTLIATPHNIAEQIRTADLVVGAVLVAGAKAPQLISRDMLATMQPGSVIVDVSIDQGGCVEGVRATSHAEPCYVEQGVVLYAVTNIPGAVARSSTLALTSRTLPFFRQLAELGLVEACRRNSHLAHGLNVHNGQLCQPEVGKAHGIASVSVAEALSS